jgi:hypothetical protein
LSWRSLHGGRREVFGGVWCVLSQEGDEPVNRDSVVLRHQSALASLLSISFIVYSSSLILHYSIYPINSVCFIYHLCPGSPRPAISTLSCRSLSIPRFPPSCTSRTARGAIPSPAWVRAFLLHCARSFSLLLAALRRLPAVRPPLPRPLKRLPLFSPQCSRDSVGPHAPLVLHTVYTVPAHRRLYDSCSTFPSRRSAYHRLAGNNLPWAGSA